MPYTNEALDNYIYAIICGDGCFHADLKFRADRKATVYKALSISLMNTERNDKLLDFLAEYLGIRWQKRKNASNRNRLNYSVNSDLVVTQTLQPYFARYSDKLPSFKAKHLKGWDSIDELKILLKKESKTENDKARINSLITTLYYIHADGLYHKYPLEVALQKFKDSWGL